MRDVRGHGLHRPHGRVLEVHKTGLRAVCERLFELRRGVLPRVWHGLLRLPEVHLFEVFEGLRHMRGNILHGVQR